MKKTRLLPFALALFASQALAQEDSIVVFNEVMYHPADNKAGAEWVELYNQNSVDIDISHWSIKGGIDFKFPAGTVIKGSGYLVVAATPASIPNALGPFRGMLDNNGEEIRLHNNSDRLMCELDYNDGGKWPLAADGAGMTLAKRDPDTYSNDPANWAWSAEFAGTPGAANFPNGAPKPSLVFNEIAGADSASFWIEITNLGAEAFSLNGYRIRTSIAEAKDYVFPENSLAPKAFLSLDLAKLGFAKPKANQRFYLMTPNQNSVLDAVELNGSGRSRLPDGKGSWYVMNDPSPGAANKVKLTHEIVINEIMYHHRPRYENEIQGQPYEEDPEEWLELLNRGTTAVDMSNWSLDEAISYTFANGTKLEPGAFLVVAKDPKAVTARFPGITIVGGFSGTLSNQGETILLRDASGNPADKVSYYSSARWPTYADGMGSSLELRDPRADNDGPDAWGASNEGAKSEWKQYSYSGVSVKPPGTSFPTQWSEFNMGLLDEGEFLIDDIEAVETPNETPRSLLKNGAFTADLSGSASATWRFRGSHGIHGLTRAEPDASDSNNNVLHVVATGPTEHMHNQIETTLVAGPKVTANKEYKISFRAKWLGGSPQLNTRLYFAWMAKTTILAAPTANGTPGKRNSIAVDNIGPTISKFQHGPTVPAVDQPITVSVVVQDPDGLDTVTLHWALDGTSGQPVIMTPNEDGVYVAQVPGQAAGAKVQFRVEAKDKTGAVGQYPKNGFSSGLMCVVNDSLAQANLGHNIRVLMSTADATLMHTETNVMSNHRIPCTVIYREREVFYDSGVRIKGSERGRNQSVRAGFSLQFPTDHLYRGVHTNMAIDRSGAGNQYSQKEILVNHAINAIGNVPGPYDDLCYVIAPRSAHTGAAMLVPRFNDVLLSSLFENGDEGRLFEYELIYYPTSATGGLEGLKKPEPDNVAGVNHRNLGDDKEAYRHHYLRKNHRAADDYGGIINLLTVMGLPQGADYQKRLPEVMDVDQWLRSFIVQSLFGVGDNYSSGAQHNMLIYIHPDGRARYFPWDMDFTFSNASSAALAGNADLSKILAANGRYFRSFYAQANEILDTVVNGPYMDKWVAHYDSYLPKESFTAFASFIKQRYTAVKKEIGTKVPKVPFEITSNGGADLSVATPTTVLEGKGWIDVKWVRVNGIRYTPEWTGRDAWRLLLPLKVGANPLELQALDAFGSPGTESALIGSDSITITNTSDRAAASADNLVISEIMYNPAATSAAERTAGFTNRDSFEYIELMNIGSSTVDLTGARFTEGISFNFDTAKIKELAAGQRLLIVANEGAFKLRHGDKLPIAGAYTDNLRNSGEELRLKSAADTIIKEFSYEDEAPWATTADGEGYSLVLKNPASNSDPNSADAWSASPKAGGSPGLGEEPTAVDGYAKWIASRGGDGKADPNGDGYSLLLEYALGADLVNRNAATLLPRVELTKLNGNVHALFRYTRRASSDAIYSVESSSNLTAWSPADMVKESETDLAGGLRQVTLRTTAPVSGAAQLRLKTQAP